MFNIYNNSFILESLSKGEAIDPNCNNRLVTTVRDTNQIAKNYSFMNNYNTSTKIFIVVLK